MKLETRPDPSTARVEWSPRRTPAPVLRAGAERLVFRFPDSHGRAASTFLPQGRAGRCPAEPRLTPHLPAPPLNPAASNHLLSRVGAAFSLSPQAVGNDWSQPSPLNRYPDFEGPALIHLFERSFEGTAYTAAWRRTSSCSVTRKTPLCLARLSLRVFRTGNPATRTPPDREKLRAWKPRHRASDLPWLPTRRRAPPSPGSNEP